MNTMDAFIDGSPDDNDEQLEDVIARAILVSEERHDGSLLDTQHAIAAAVLHSDWLKRKIRVAVHDAQLNAQMKIIELIETHLVETIDSDAMELIETLIENETLD